MIIQGRKLKIVLNDETRKYLMRLFYLNNKFINFVLNEKKSNFNYLKAFKDLYKSESDVIDFTLFESTLDSIKCGKITHFNSKNSPSKIRVRDQIILFKDYFVFKKVPELRFYLYDLKDLSLERIFNMNLSFDGLSFYFSFSKNLDISYSREYKINALGLDLGVKNFLALSNKTIIRNVNNEARMKKLDAKLNYLRSELDRRRNFFKSNNLPLSSNYYKLDLKFKKYLRRAREIRRDYLYKCVNYCLSLKPRNIIIEDLSVKEMVHENPLAKRIEEATFRKFRTILEYKCKWHHINLIVANRYYPSSKKCSNCGYINHDLTLSDRTYICPKCGLKIDRDINAAINLKNLLKKENKEELKKCKIEVNAPIIKRN